MTSHICETEYAAQCGRLIIWTHEGRVVMCDWANSELEKSKKRVLKALRANVVQVEDETSQRLKIQLDEYFIGKRKEFDIPTLLIGTEFQKTAWQALTSIPYGQTISYKEEAEKIGRPNAFRAVGNANNANAIVIIYPCHRVIGSDGQFVGYAGGLNVKQYLLELEQRNCNDNGE